MKHRLLIMLLLATVGRTRAATNDDVLPARFDHPPNQPYLPAEACSKMTVPHGFHVDLVASEPELVNPIAMTFDDRGRIFITESVEYPRKSAGPGRDLIKLIAGVDDLGRATKVGVFAEGFNIPTGVAVGHGGVWVLNSPDLLFLREQDGKEVSREVVLTGFGRTDFHELPSSLTWGPDCWLYGLNGVFNESHVIAKDGKRHDFTCAMWRIHPRTREFQVFAEGTSNPYGIVWDNEGSAIIEACHWATDHLFHFVETGYYERQAGAYPPFTMKLGSITDHGHQKTAYCGIALLDTGSFPEQYRGRIVVGNLHGGCLNVDRLERDGATYLGRGEPDLLTGNDDWFMPVSLKVGPDGCLYVLDWYDRYHCSQDAIRDPEGVDRLRGRLYRLRYGDSPRQPKYDLAMESDDQLIARLASANIYFRESAQRVLAERMGQVSGDLRAKLESKAKSGPASTGLERQGRLHALWALMGGGSLEPVFHASLLTNSDPAFRAWAVRAAGNQGEVLPDLRDGIAALARDPAPEVQLQTAIAARKIYGCDAMAVLLDVLRHCGQDKIIPAIVWQNLHPLLETNGTRLVALLKKDGRNSPVPAVETLLPRALDRLLAARVPDIAAAVALLEYTMQVAPRRAPDCIAAISSRTGGLNEAAVANLRQQLRPLIEKVLQEQQTTPLFLSTQLLAARLGLAAGDAAEVRRKFVSNNESEATRLQALEALIAFRDSSLLESLPGVLRSAPPGFAGRVFAALGRCEEARLADVILLQYPSYAPELQPLAVELLMQREPWARKLLDAVLAGQLPRGVLNANYLRKIMDSNDREAIWAVEKAFGAVREERNPEREKVVAEMGDYLRNHLGDPYAGGRVFKSFCAQCHAIYGEGAKVGPDITSNGRSSFDQLISNVFDPSLVIGPSYQITTVVTKDGRNLTGLIVEESDQRLVIRMPGEGEETVSRNNVKYTHRSKLSMMPEGIENLLSKKDLADLFAFLSLDKPPGDPTAKPIPGAPPPGSIKQ
jgi:putative heme-binding domain-containing protein